MSSCLVVQTVVRREAFAAAHVERQEGLVPWMLRVAPSGLAMFPGYLLVFSSLVSAWRSLRGTRGVLGVLGELPERDVARLRAWEGCDGLVQLPPRFAPGDPVRMRRGWISNEVPLLFEGMVGADRAAVLMTMLGRRDVRQVVLEADLAPA